MAESFEVRVPGGVLHGERAGSGRPAIVLHGGPGMTDYTATLTAELAEDFDTIRYQQRGVAPSATAGSISVDAHVEDLVTLMDALAIGRAWLVGHSWGGHLAMHAAVAHPERVEALVTIGTLGARPDGGMQEFIGTMDARFRTLYGRERTDETELEEVWPLYFARPEAAPQFPGIVTSPALETHESWVAHFERQTLETGLPAFPGPAIFIHGREDPLSWQASAASAELTPGARLIVLDDLGHFPWLESPGAVLAAIRSARG